MTSKSERRTLTELVEEAVDQGATTAEEIHREIANLPLNVLERLDVFQDAAGEMKQVQDSTIGAIYDAVRDINHKVSELAKDLLEERKKG